MVRVENSWKILPVVSVHGFRRIAVTPEDRRIQPVRCQFLKFERQFWRENSHSID